MATIEKPDATSRAGSQIGRSVPRVEGRDKVTGRAEYVHTMRLPGMLVAKRFRKHVAHAGACNNRLTMCSMTTSALPVRPQLNNAKYDR